MAPLRTSFTKRGPKELTGMVDLTRDKQGRTRARLLDLVPGRSGTVYKDWLTDRQQHRLAEAIAADDRHNEAWVAWQCAQRVRAVYHQPDPATGRALAEQILAGFPSCPIPETARLGKTLKQWRDAFLGYFHTGGANNGGTEAINGLIELHRRIARGFRNRDNYRLRMLLIAGGLDQPPPQV